MDAAEDANLFRHNPEYMFRINTCRLGKLIELCKPIPDTNSCQACALEQNDDKKCTSIIRGFMHDYQFTTDTYRLYAAIHRICRTPTDWYHAGPSQKFIMRQIKTMDLIFLPEDQRKEKTKAGTQYYLKDSKGQKLVNKDLDVALLTLYGQILVQSASYHYALSESIAPPYS